MQDVAAALPGGRAAAGQSVCQLLNRVRHQSSQRGDFGKQLNCRIKTISATSTQTNFGLYTNIGDGRETSL